MTWSDRDVTDARDCLGEAHDALDDVWDFADESDDEQTKDAVAQIQADIEALRQRLSGYRPPA